MTRFLLLSPVVLSLVLSCALAADDANSVKKLKSADAKKAIQAYEKSVDQAREEYEKRVAAARKTLLADLEKAQNKATEAKQLDDALTIREIRQSFQGERLLPVGSVWKGYLGYDSSAPAELPRKFLATWTILERDGDRFKAKHEWQDEKKNKGGWEFEGTVDPTGAIAWKYQKYKAEGKLGGKGITIKGIQYDVKPGVHARWSGTLTLAK